MGQLAPVQSEALDPDALPCVVDEALLLPDADAPELGDAGVVVLVPPPVEAPAEVLLSLDAQPAASMAAAMATPIAFRTIETSLGG